VFGAIIGFLLMGVIVWLAMPPMMINVHKSPYGFDETVVSVEVVSTMMPLGIGVYETKDGSVYMSEMNIGLMGMMFGGTIADVMGDASTDITKMMGAVTAK